MESIITEVTALSSKGQIVLPKIIRDSLSLETGCKLMVFADGDNILIKPIKAPDREEFSRLMQESKIWAERVGMQESDISEAIKYARRER